MTEGVRYLQDRGDENVTPAMGLTFVTRSWQIRAQMLRALSEHKKRQPTSRRRT